MSLDELTNQYDTAFQNIHSLTWLPWVGQRFPERPPRKRLLVVGESHYYLRDAPEQRQAKCDEYLKDPKSTRDVVSDVLVNRAWHNKTLDNIPKMLFKTTEIDRHRLWGDSAYYNFVQRPMDYNQESQPERPKPDDFDRGWRVFAEIIRIIQPSHCLFLGVAAASSFNLGTASCTQLVGRTWARVAKVETAGTSTELMFVQHPGKYFSWLQWHHYLQAQHPDLMGWLEAESYATSPNAQS